jgi:hypothetical protein
LGILAKGDSLLIFPEGISVNGWELRPLGKGTARIANQAWHHASCEHMQVLPIRLLYGSFHEPYPNVRMRTGTTMGPGLIPAEPAAIFLRSFNELLRERLLAINSDVERSMEGGADPSARGNMLRIVLLAPFAGIAFLLHAPWYYALRSCAAHTTRGTVFFDPVLFGALLLTYPLWLGALTATCWCLGMGPSSMLIWIVAPALALALRHFVIALRMRSGGSRAFVGRT